MTDETDWLRREVDAAYGRGIADAAQRLEDVARAVQAKPRDAESIELFAEDDLVERAENIVFLLGYRGAVGGFVLNVYEVLKTYARLDAEAAAAADQGGTEPAMDATSPGATAA